MKVPALTRALAEAPFSRRLISVLTRDDATRYHGRALETWRPSIRLHHPARGHDWAVNLNQNSPVTLDPSGADLHAEAAALRARGAATAVELPGRIRAWAVTDPGLIERLLVHPGISKDAHRHWPDFRDGVVPADWPLRIWVDVHNALTAYGTDHTRLRKPLAAAFTARRVRILTGPIQRITDLLLDDVEAAFRDSNTVDLRRLFAWQLPLRVVNELLGVPEHLHEDFRTAVGDIFRTDLSSEDALAVHRHALELLTGLIEHKRRDGGDDVTSSLIRHRDETDALTEQELMDSLLLLIGAGHETTVNLLDHAVTLLLSHPEQLALLHHGTVRWQDAIEEVLRVEAPVASIPLRFAVDDVVDEETGTHLEKGDPILIHFAGAGRDPQRHGPEADRFDITRSGTGHLAFGHGVHFCLGAPLARLEAAIALPALFARFPSLALAERPDDLRPLPSFITNGHRTLPVRLGS